MKRIEFIRNIFGAAVVTAIPNRQYESESQELEFSFDDIFHQHSGNPILFYPNKDSFIYQKIKEQLGNERILPKERFCYYLGVHDVLIPIKDKYRFSDFQPFILCLKSYYKRNNLFSETEQGSFFRMISQKDGTMHFDLFVGKKEGQYQF